MKLTDGLNGVLYGRPLDQFLYQMQLPINTERAATVINIIEHILLVSPGEILDFILHYIQFIPTSQTHLIRPPPILDLNGTCLNSFSARSGPLATGPRQPVGQPLGLVAVFVNKPMSRP